MLQTPAAACTPAFAVAVVVVVHQAWSNNLTAIHPYGPTAARHHGKLGRELRLRSTTIDIHAHVGVPAAAALVAPHLDISTVPLAFFTNPETARVNQQQDIDRGSRLNGVNDGLAERLRDLDAMGIDRQVVMPPPPQCYYTVPLDLAVKATRLVNDTIAEFVTRSPDRLNSRSAASQCRTPTKRPPNSTASCVGLASRE